MTQSEYEKLGHIKNIRSKDTMELLTNQPKAYILLNHIALRTNRDGRGGFFGCKIGEAVISHTSCGMTEQEYRTAKKVLSNAGYAKFEVRWIGAKRVTYATLTSTCIFDANLPTEINTTSTSAQQATNGLTTNKEGSIKHYQSIDYSNEKEPAQHASNGQITEGHTSSNDKQEERRNKKEKSYKSFKEISKAPEEGVYALPTNVLQIRDNVCLEETEHKKLLSEYGERIIEGSYDRLSNWKHSKNKGKGNVKFDSNALQDWCILKEREMQAKEKRISEEEQRTNNPEQYWKVKNHGKIETHIKYLKELRNALTSNDAILQWNEKGVYVGRHRPDPNYQPSYILFSSPTFKQDVEHSLKKEGVFPTSKMEKKG